MKGFSWKAGVVLLVTFVLGGVAGGFAMRATHHKRFGRHFGGPPHEAREKFLVEAMSRRLDLDDGQRDKIRTIIESHRDERRAISEKCRPEHDALRDKVDAEVAAVLTPEQKKLHEELRERRAKRRKRH